jgi:thiamine biosynthesis lipoprotein
MLILLGLALSACSGEGGGYVKLQGATMGTYYRVTARCPGIAADGVRARVEQTVSEVNGRMSTYLPDSELSRFNDAPVGVWQPASPELIEVISVAAEISRLSGGAFDVTVGPLVNLWGFGPDGAITESPEPAAVREALARVGSAHLLIDTGAGALKKDTAVYVDLSAIAKGYGVDRVVDQLVLAGCPDLLVDIGGEVAARGLNPSGSTWRVGIEVPDPSRIGGVERVVPLSGMAIATSGDYRNFLDLDQGRHRVSHTIDPRTGHPIEHDLASVSVLHASTMWADGLATALDVLGPDAGPQLAEREGLAAVFIIRRAGGFEERYTPAMRNYLETQQ